MLSISPSDSLLTLLRVGRERSNEESTGYCEEVEGAGEKEKRGGEDSAGIGSGG